MSLPDKQPLSALNEQTVYVPVDVKNEMPPKGMAVSASFDGQNFQYTATGKGWKPTEVRYTHWLRPSAGYFHTPDEMRKLIGEVWEACMSAVMFEDQPDGELKDAYTKTVGVPLNKQQLLNKLLKG